MFRALWSLLWKKPLFVQEEKYLVELSQLALARTRTAAAMYGRS